MKTETKAENGWELERLFAAYRRCFDDFEPSPDFLARVWNSIESRRTPSWVSLVRLWSPRLALLSAAATALLGLGVWAPERSAREDSVLERSYLDALTADTLDEEEAAIWTLAELELAQRR